MSKIVIQGTIQDMAPIDELFEIVVSALAQVPYVQVERESPTSVSMIYDDWGFSVELVD